MFQSRNDRCPGEVYLDNNATTAVLPCAATAVLHHMQTCFGNPSSSHSTGIKAKVELELTRQLARQVIGASRGQIVFTSGATRLFQHCLMPVAVVKPARKPCCYMGLLNIKRYRRA